MSSCRQCCYSMVIGVSILQPLFAVNYHYHGHLSLVCYPLVTIFLWCLSITDATTSFNSGNLPLVASATILQLHWPSSSPYLLLTIVIYYCQHPSPAFHFTSSPIHSIFDLILPTLLHKNTLFPNLRCTQDSNLSLRETLETFF